MPTWDTAAAARCLPRHRLRQLADSARVPHGRGAPGARTIIVRITDGAVAADQEATVRHGTTVLIAESPAPISDSARELCHRLAVDMARAANHRKGTIEITVALDADGGAMVTEVDAIERTLTAVPEAITIEAHVMALGSGTVTGSPIQGPEATTTFKVSSWDKVSERTPLATCTASAPTRDKALSALARCLDNTVIGGVPDNVSGLLAAVEGVIADGKPWHGAMALPQHQAGSIVEVLAGGLQTTVQDAPGRVGLWEIGVPPSGPMDDLALKLANEAVGNKPGCAGLEITLGGPTLRFPRAATIALAGAPFVVELNGEPINYWTPINVPAGGILCISGAMARGLRCYLAIRGGLAVPTYLGSASTFTLGGFGGHAGRQLAAGDNLPLAADYIADPKEIPNAHRPKYPRKWELGVRLGPHTNPEFLTDEGIATFIATTWTVSPQSNRTGVRLDGPAPLWAREDGGEAGLHPSNLHDNAYAFGAVDLTGDTPVILGPDGPSLGGFACPLVVVEGQRWKLGQLRPGDKVRFSVVDAKGAASLRQAPWAPPKSGDTESPILHQREASDTLPELCLRRQGDAFLLLEMGPMALDIGQRLRIQSIYRDLDTQRESGLIDIVPGIRSVQVHYDPERLSEDNCAAMMLKAAESLAGADLSVPSRTVHLPLSWDDPSTRKAIDIYMRTVNPDAPWCPWNIEFIRRINGLSDVQQVKDIVYNADYLVMGLGDVYLGAPVATPLDPRHRLVTTKYNPARTWTPENAVGIGGAYLCVYGMEGPGGYQFVGRTIQMWNTPSADNQVGASFEQGTPWLLRQFDRLKFFEVSAEELLDLREDFPKGRYDVTIEDGTFALDEYEQFLDANNDDIISTRTAMQEAFRAERERWGLTSKETP